MPSAKKEAKKQREAAAQGGSPNGKSKKSQGQGKAQRQKNEIVPWGWEESAKQDRKKKVAERQAAEAASKAAKEAADNPELVQKPKVKSAPKEDKAAAPAGDAKPKA